MEHTGGSQDLDARKNASETWIGRWQGTLDVCHEGRCEEPHGCGEQSEESGVPEVDQQQDVLSQWTTQ